MGLAGEGMMDPTLANQIPSVMAQFREGSSVGDYKDKVATIPQFRAAQRRLVRKVANYHF